MPCFSSIQAKIQASLIFACLSETRVIPLKAPGDKGIRTLDPLLARQVLSHLSYTPLKKSGSLLLSHTVASIVSSAAQGLTIVFGMGTGVTPRRIATGSGTKWTRTTDLTLIRRAL